MESVPGAVKEHQPVHHLFTRVEEAPWKAPGAEEDTAKGQRVQRRGQGRAGGHRAARGMRAVSEKDTRGRPRAPAPVAGGLGCAGEERGKDADGYL